MFLNILNRLSDRNVKQINFGFRQTCDQISDLQLTSCKVYFYIGESKLPNSILDVLGSDPFNSKPIVFNLEQFLPFTVMYHREKNCVFSMCHDKTCR
jgi:hypothetical protein